MRERVFYWNGGSENGFWSEAHAGVYPEYQSTINLVASLKRAGFKVRVVDARDLCRCEHPKHQGQCPHPEGCWCDSFSKNGVPPAARR